MIMDHGGDRPRPTRTDGLLYDPSLGVVRPRFGGGIAANWAVAAALLALTLLAGAVAYPIATQAPIFRVAAEH